ncbi:hypothetical protein [Ramlibacter sp. PS4R-6]|uniref:hypothetical protein n=1 Tax=Ramlibacter sp. PS4R-6 TaxID=3133438 RepID=UPI0030A9BE6F
MRTVLVRYKVKPDAAAENERLIGAVFAQLERDTPEGLRYQVFKGADGVSFTHVSAFDTNDGNPLTKLTAFKAFTAGIAERCEEPPVTTQVEAVGRFDNL